MRQYRGLTKEGKMVYGGHCKVGNKDYIIPDNAIIRVFPWRAPDTHCQTGIQGAIEVIPETAEQQVGLKDKNGEDLDWWEGDIFARASDRRIEGTIIFDMGCFWLERKRDGRTPLYECVDWSMYKVGNIHQNPELIEQNNGE